MGCEDFYTEKEAPNGVCPDHETPLEMDRAKPWEMQKQGQDQQLREFLDEAVRGLRSIVYWIEPFMPGTAVKLRESLFGEMPLKRGAPLFPRLKP